VVYNQQPANGDKNLKGRLILAEHATAHQDGTLSILRSGINAAWGKLPVPFQGALATRIEGDLGDSGSHRFDLRCMNSDGADVMPKLQGGFEVPKGGGVMNFVLSISMQFPGYGSYTFVLRVDDVQLDSWSISVTEGGPQGGATR
jgi:hypothetical protein